MVLESPEKEGPFGKAHIISEERMKNYMRDLGKSNVHRIRLRFSRVFVPDWRKLEMLFNVYDEIIRDKGPIKSEVRKQLFEKLGEIPQELA